MSKKIDKSTFLNLYESELDKNKKLDAEESKYLSIFLDMVNANIGYFTIKEWAYVFATTFHETAHTFKPVIEAFWLSEEWRKKNLRYYPYHGRGYVQITWEENYKKFSKLLGVDLVSNPELTLNPSISFEILIYGFKNGTFTSKKISDYMDFKSMRKCINGTDKSDLIASYGNTFESILNKSLK